MLLSMRVEVLPGIGPKYQKLLQNLNIYTVYDLIYHFPFRYDDFSTVTKISDLTENQLVTICAIILDVKNIYTKNKKKLTIATVQDETAQIDVIWFNQHYLSQKLKKGKKYNFSGKTGLYGNKLNFISPTFELYKDNSLNTGRLVPIYNETKGISSKWLRARINDVLPRLNTHEELKEFIPQNLIEKRNLIGIKDALTTIHFPENLTQVDQARKRLGYNELFLELLKVQTQKNKWQNDYEGIHLDKNKTDSQIQFFVKSLPFELTKTQQNALNQIFKDLNTKFPMNRMLEGDVGSGKTIVAIICAYLCSLNGYKTLYMAPTEILANQHYNTFCNFLKEIDIKLKTSSNNTQDITKDKNDIIIGTHALLHEKQNLKNVGLVIIDEQHRFGVNQRAKLLEMGTKEKKPNLLTMTATPIPRTLALTIYGDLDISVLDSVPNKDKKITTKVIPETQRDKIFEWIKKKGEQAFIVCPFITESEHEQFENVKAAQEEYKKLTNGIFKNISVGLLHGKLKPEEKQQVMNDFKNKKYQILISTPVIEVGVDIPEATIIVIESAERYGLASLHQLRGRVGRGVKEGFCFIFMSNFSKTAYNRLKNLENIDNGLKLAEIDLQYRGQGDIFGVEQHGFKNFKIADLSDLEFVEEVKQDVEEYVNTQPSISNITMTSIFN